MPKQKFRLRKIPSPCPICLGVPIRKLYLTIGLTMPRPQKSLVDLEINGFLVVECLSDTESTTGNFQPRYLVRCTHCGKERTRSKQGLHGIKPCRCLTPKPPPPKPPVPTLSPIAPDARVITKALLLRRQDTPKDASGGPQKSPATPDGTLLYIYPGHPSYSLGRKPKPVQKESTP